MTGVGGVGSVAGVKNNLTATSELANFNTPLSISLINTSQDWKMRQKIEYAGLQGLIAKDFLSLDDWALQIQLYSHGNYVQLAGPLAAIQQLLKKNGLYTASELIPDPHLGTVGNYLEQLPGFSDVFVSEADILSHSDHLSTALGVG